MLRTARSPPVKPKPGGGVFAFVNSPQLDARSRVAFLGAVSGTTGAFLATPRLSGSSGFVDIPYASGCTGVIVDTTPDRADRDRLGSLPGA
ncbi:MAG TPA: hypothetical protein VN918_05885 [Myxococcaceae bacterium]|nr:hypothetical protein [Myxococcaceae bacterium]